MDITQTARSLIALRNWQKTRNESGMNEYCTDGLCLSLSEKPGGQDEAEAPSSTAKSRTITLCGAFNLPEADAEELKAKVTEALPALAPAGV